MATIAEKDWVARYTPVKNHLNPKGTTFDGTCFETYGEELAYVTRTEPHKIWTLVEYDDKLFIMAGWHIVNRLGYFITAVPWSDPDLEVTLDD